MENMGTSVDSRKTGFVFIEFEVSLKISSGEMPGEWEWSAGWEQTDPDGSRSFPSILLAVCRLGRSEWAQRKTGSAECWAQRDPLVEWSPPSPAWGCLDVPATPTLSVSREHSLS